MRANPCGYRETASITPDPVSTCAYVLCTNMRRLDFLKHVRDDIKDDVVQIMERNSEGNPTAVMLPVCNLKEAIKILSDAQRVALDNRNNPRSTTEVWEDGDPVAMSFSMGGNFTNDARADLRQIVLSENTILSGLDLREVDCRGARMYVVCTRSTCTHVTP